MVPAALLLSLGFTVRPDARAALAGLAAHRARCASPVAGFFDELFSETPEQKAAKDAAYEEQAASYALRVWMGRARLWGGHGLYDEQASRS